MPGNAGTTPGARGDRWAAKSSSKSGRISDQMRSAICHAGSLFIAPPREHARCMVLHPRKHRFDFFEALISTLVVISLPRVDVAHDHGLVESCARSTKQFRCLG